MKYGLVNDEEIECVSFELNHDHAGFELHGAKAVTLKAFDGAFKRLYNMGNVLREEVRGANVSLDVDNMFRLLQGGVSEYQSKQLIYEMMRKLDATLEAVKVTNGLVSELVGSVRRLVAANMRSPQ